MKDLTRRSFVKQSVAIAGPAMLLEKKKSALFAHVSQDGQGIWRRHHEIMAAWRGREAGVGAAEGFVHLSRDTQSSRLPGL